MTELFESGELKKMLEKVGAFSEPENTEETNNTDNTDKHDSPSTA